MLTISLTPERIISDWLQREGEKRERRPWVRESGLRKRKKERMMRKRERE